MPFHVPIPAQSSRARWRSLLGLLAIVVLAAGRLAVLPLGGSSQLYGQDAHDLGPQLLQTGKSAAPARLLGIDEHWQVSLQLAGERQSVPAASIVAWGAQRDATRGPQVLLTDGSQLVTRGLNLAGERLAAQCELWGEPQGTDVWGTVNLSLAQVRGILFRPPLDSLQRDRLIARLLAAEGERDRLLLDNGDELSGVLTGLDDAQVRLDTPAGAAVVPRDKIIAALLDPALRPAPRPAGLHALIGFRTGSVLNVAKAETAPQVVAGEATDVRLTLVCGAVLNSNPDEANVWQAAVSLQVLGGDALYLSDLKTLGYKHVPLLSLPWSYGNDRNVLGGMLRAGKERWPKGLGMHSTSRLAWALPAGMKRFAAELAVDAAAGDAGSVRYRVYRDNPSGDFVLAYESDIVRGGQAPVPMSVDIDGARRLVLIVEYADHGDQRDYANWLNARLEK